MKISPILILTLAWFAACGARTGLEDLLPPITTGGVTIGGQPTTTQTEMGGTLVTATGGNPNLGTGSSYTAASGGSTSGVNGGQSGTTKAETGGVPATATGGNSNVGAGGTFPNGSGGAMNTAAGGSTHTCSSEELYAENDGGGGAHTLTFEACCQCGWPANGATCTSILKILPFWHSANDTKYYRCIGGEVPSCILDHLDSCTDGLPAECVAAYAAQVACISQP